MLIDWFQKIERKSISQTLTGDSFVKSVYMSEKNDHLSRQYDCERGDEKNEIKTTLLTKRVKELEAHLRGQSWQLLHSSLNQQNLEMQKMKQFNLLRKSIYLTISLLAPMMIAGAIPAAAQIENIDNTAKNTIQPDKQIVPVHLSSFDAWLYPIGSIVFILIFLPKIGWIAGLIVINEKEVGIVTKKFSAKSLAPGRLIALNGEAGTQADTLPPGWHFGYFPWQYSIQKSPLVIIPQDEIGLIIANDGSAIPPNRILGKVVESDNFQNARQFLTNGGEKGRQVALLTTGMYRLNTALFTVITSSNAIEHGMSPEQT